LIVTEYKYSDTESSYFRGYVIALPRNNLIL